MGKETAKRGKREKHLSFLFYERRKDCRPNDDLKRRKGKKGERSVSPHTERRGKESYDNNTSAEGRQKMLTSEEGEENVRYSLRERKSGEGNIKLKKERGRLYYNLLNER